MNFKTVFSRYGKWSSVVFGVCLPIFLFGSLLISIDIGMHAGSSGGNQFRDAVVVQESPSGTKQCWMLKHLQSAGSWNDPEVWFSAGPYGFFLYGGVVNYIRENNAHWTLETFNSNARLLGVEDPSKCHVVAGDSMTSIIER